MSAQPTAEDFAKLRATVATLQAEVTSLQRRRRRARRLLPLLAVALLVALAPLSALATNPFNDLNPGSVHNVNIDAIYNAHVTTGCDPDVSYCPNASVTREEMASFLARLGGLGSNPPVANAKTAQTATTAGHATTTDSATNATNAGNATTVGGYAPSGLVRVAHGSDESFSSGLTVSPLLTVQITAPGAGFVLVIGTSTLFTAHGNICPCRAAARLLHVNAGTTTPDMLVVVPGTTGASSGAGLALTWVFPVAAGQQTFALLGTTGPVPQYNPTLTALFVPFGYDGGTTLAP